MTVETLIENLSAEDRRGALELLWKHIERDDPLFAPPQWHETVIAERLKNLSTEPSLPLREAMIEVTRRIDEHRASS